MDVEWYGRFGNFFILLGCMVGILLGCISCSWRGGWGYLVLVILRCLLGCMRYVGGWGYLDLVILRCMLGCMKDGLMWEVCSRDVVLWVKFCV